VVERDLAKVDVAGSTPVSRSKFSKSRPMGAFLFWSPRAFQWTFSQYKANLGARARYPSGKGEVCKTFMREFDSHPRLHSFLVVRVHSRPLRAYSAHR
jgi:hypothetical protein